MNNLALQYLTSIMAKASGMLDHFIIPLEPEELYEMLCGHNQTFLGAAITIANYLEPKNYHDMVSVPVLLHDMAQPMNIQFTVSLEKCHKYPSYIMPQTVAVLTPESKLFDKIMPGIVLAQEWRITQDLFGRLSKVLTTEQIASVLPWTKELGRDGVAEMDAMTDNHRFANLHGLGWLTEGKKKAMYAGLKRLGNPGRPSDTPALTRRIAEAARLGDRLFAQYRMLKTKDAARITGTFVAVALTDAVLPMWYLSDIVDVLGTWEEEEVERRAEIANAKARKEWGQP
jgi:hypothetical protein